MVYNLNKKREFFKRYPKKERTSSKIYKSLKLIKMAEKVPKSGPPTVTAVATELLTEAAEVIDTSTYFGSKTEYSDF